MVVKSNPGRALEDLGPDLDDWTPLNPDNIYVPGGRQDIPGWRRPQIPLGFPSIPEIHVPRVRVPEIHPEVTTPATVPIFGTPGYNPGPRTGQVQVQDPFYPDREQPLLPVARDWFEYHEMAAQGLVVVGPDGTTVSEGGTFTPQTVASTPLHVQPGGTVLPGVTQPQFLPDPGMGPAIIDPGPTKRTGDGPMDLGTLIADLAGGYIDARWGTPATTSYVSPTTTTVPPATVYARDTAGNLLVTKKKCRRRRRRLATLSDIRDLGALKSILSPSDLKTWIATHPT